MKKVLDIISLNYKEDAKNIYDYVKSIEKNIILSEYYPFFQFLGYKSVIYQNNKMFKCHIILFPILSSFFISSK